MVGLSAASPFGAMVGLSLDGVLAEDDVPRQLKAAGTGTSGRGTSSSSDVTTISRRADSRRLLLHRRGGH
eukprot:2756690-Pyramimonas_sp.AAC.2